MAAISADLSTLSALAWLNKKGTQDKHLRNETSFLLRSPPLIFRLLSSAVLSPVPERREWESSPSSLTR